MADDIDDLLGQIDAKEKLRDEAAAKCRDELDAGRTGLTQLSEAQAHHKDLVVLVERARQVIDQALRDLGA